MKIALLFLACLAGISCHQRYIWQYPQVARYYPFVFPNDNRYVFVNSEESPKIVGNEEELQAVERRSRPQSRFGLFGNIPLLPLFSSTTSLAPFTLLSTTTFVTVTSTVTTVSILTCLPSTVFVNALAITSTCARRKREAVPIEGLEDDIDDRLPISASSVQSIETSAIPTLDIGRHYEDDQPQVVSSQSEIRQPVFRLSLPTYRQNINLLAPLSSSSSQVTYLVTYTSTVTSYTFTNTLVKRTLNLVAPPPVGSGGPITCLPVGFAVC